MIFTVNYVVGKGEYFGENVVCENEEDIINIIAERRGTSKDKIEKLDFSEKSKEKVYVRDLTVGDLLRIIKE